MDNASNINTSNYAIDEPISSLLEKIEFACITFGNFKKLQKSERAWLGIN